MKKFSSLDLRPWIGGVVGAFCLAAGTAEAFTFTKVIDKFTPFPDGFANIFIPWGGDAGAAALEGDIVVFGNGSGDNISLWAAKLSDHTFTRLVDNHTPIPNRVENFTLEGYATIDQGRVVFAQYGGTLRGFYSVSAAGGAITTLADQGTPIPGGTTNFSQLDAATGRPGFHAGDGHLVFPHSLGSGNPPGNIGIYSVPIAGGAVQTVINDSFAICELGFGFAGPAADVSGNTVVIIGGDVFGRGIIYTLPLGGAVGVSANPCPFSSTLKVTNHTIVASSGTPVPDDPERRNFDPFEFRHPLIDGSTIVFQGGASNQNAVNLRGLYSLHPGGLAKLVDTNTPVPGGNGNFTHDIGFTSRVALNGGQVVFEGIDANDRRGLYLVPATGGPVTKIIAEGDLLGDGHTVNDFRFGNRATIKPDSLNGGKLAIALTNAPFQAAIYVANLDTTPPETGLTSAPPNPDASTNPSFGFGGTDDFTSPASLSFECQLDGGGFAACTSPKTYAGLSSGSHTFEVRAKDSAGNVDSTPASHTWTRLAPAADTAPGVSLEGSVLTIKLVAGANAGQDADWWLVAMTPWGHWYSYVYPSTWVDIGTDLSHVIPAYQGPLVDISRLALFDTQGVPRGRYVIYFGVDTNRNGVLDMDRLHYSSVLLDAP